MQVPQGAVGRSLNYIQIAFQTDPDVELDKGCPMVNLNSRLCSLLVMMAALTPHVAFASSDDAWAEFRVDVAEACRTAMGLEADAALLVEPFGSERFGYAVHQGDTGPMVCVYEKTTGATEVGRDFVETQ